MPSRDLDEDEAKTLLGQLGIATPPRRACSDRAEAHRALAELPGPLAVKLLDAEVTHKSDVGGVHLGVRDAAALDAALDALEAIGAARFLVESMAPAGIDLIVGASRDPVFGPVVLVGLGGVVAEALADVAVTPAPLSVQDGGALADGLSRSRPPRRLPRRPGRRPHGPGRGPGRPRRPARHPSRDRRRGDQPAARDRRRAARARCRADPRQGGPSMTRIRTVTPTAEGVVPWPEEAARQLRRARVVARVGARRRTREPSPTRTPTPSPSSTGTCGSPTAR